MLNLISCELLKLKRSKMVLISVAGVLSTPLFDVNRSLANTILISREIIFTLSDIYSDSVLYSMLLVNIMRYMWQLQLTCLAESTQKAPSKPYCPYPFQGQNY